MKYSSKPRHFARKPKKGLQNTRHPGGCLNGSGMDSTSFFELFGKLFGALSRGDRGRFFRNELKKKGER